MNDTIQGFQEQVAGFKDPRQLIEDRGYWKIVIHRKAFFRRKVASTSILRKLVGTYAVKTLPLKYPFLRNNDFAVGEDWLGIVDIKGHRRDSWRLYLSGLFVHYCAMFEDWIDRREDWDGISPGDNDQLFAIGNSVRQLTSILKFASQLSLSELGDDQMSVEIQISGLANRKLWFDSPSPSPPPEHRSHVPEGETYRFDRILNSEELAERHQALALECAGNLFGLFDWHPDRRTIESLQR